MQNYAAKYKCIWNCDNQSSFIVLTQRYRIMIWILSPELSYGSGEYLELNCYKIEVKSLSIILRILLSIKKNGAAQFAFHEKPWHKPRYIIIY